MYVCLSHFVCISLSERLKLLETFSCLTHQIIPEFLGFRIARFFFFHPSWVSNAFYWFFWRHSWYRTTRSHSCSRCSVWFASWNTSKLHSNVECTEVKFTCLSEVLTWIITNVYMKNAFGLSVKWRMHVLRVYMLTKSWLYLSWLRALCKPITRQSSPSTPVIKLRPRYWSNEGERMPYRWAGPGNEGHGSNVWCEARIDSAFTFRCEGRHFSSLSSRLISPLEGRPGGDSFLSSMVWVAGQGVSYKSVLVGGCL